MFNVKVIGADTAKNTLAVAKDLQAVTAPARLFTATAYNSSGVTVYLQVHDAAATPADGAIPKLVIPLPTKQTGFFDYSDGAIFAAGVYICLSTTDTTKTLVGVDSGIIDCTFRKTS